MSRSILWAIKFLAFTVILIFLYEKTREFPLLHATTALRIHADNITAFKAAAAEVEVPIRAYMLTRSPSYPPTSSSPTVSKVLVVEPAQNQSGKPCYYSWSRDTRKFECLYHSSVQQKFNLLLPGSLTWNAQAGQDRIVHELLGGISGGYFVDLAANDWKDLSNTYTLERSFSWKGLCIEPNPAYLQGLLENRDCLVIANPVSNSTGDSITFAYKGAMGGIVSSETDLNPMYIRGSPIKLITVTLSLILDTFHAPKTIEFLSLDVEGAEGWVIQGFDFERYNFKIISVERPSEYVHKVLSEKGYRWLTQGKPIGILYGECIYVHNNLNVSQELFKKYKQYRVTDWGVLGKRSFHDYLLSPVWD